MVMLEKAVIPPAAADPEGGGKRTLTVELGGVNQG